MLPGAVLHFLPRLLSYTRKLDVTSAETLLYLVALVCVAHGIHMCESDAEDSQIFSIEMRIWCLLVSFPFSSGTS